MKMWKRLAKSKKFTLEEFDMPELWVEIIPMTVYPQRVIEQYIDKDNGIFELCISKWNFSDPDTKEEYPLPKDNPDVMKDIPTMVMMWLANKIKEENDASLPPSSTSGPITS